MSLGHAPPSDVNRLLAAATNGDAHAVAALFDVLYRELRKMAVGAMRSERADHTLQPTALVHEVFIRLADEPMSLENRAHFFGIASTAMRRVLIEHARARLTAKRGGRVPRVAVDDVDLPWQATTEGVDITALDDALTRLAAVDARQARIVELRFFGGLTVEESASVLGLSPRTVKREWQMSRAWLKRDIEGALPA